MDDLTSIQATSIQATTRPKAKISAEERARRQKAIDYGRGTVRLEGFIASDAVEELGRQFVEGEITLAEHTAAIRQRHGL